MTIINYTSLAFRIQSILTVQVGFNWSSFKKYIPTMMHAQQCLQNTGCAYDLLNKYNLLPSTSFIQLHLKDHCNSFSSWRSNIRGMQTTFGQENVGYKFSIIYQKFYKLRITCIYIWWHTSAITCQIIMLTCQIFMSSCQIFMLTCQIFMLTCHLFIC